jgi:catechol 2,3-dioxygenase-like lactoylglutathione lyase family enzyme
MGKQLVSKGTGPLIVDFFQIVVQVPDIDTSVRAYVQDLAYRQQDAAPLDAALAAHWDAPLLAGRRQALLGPASGAASWIRFVEGEAFPPLGTGGWNGIELLVRDLDATECRLARSVDFPLFSPPQTLSLSDKVRFMQVQGPAGELLFLNQMDDPSFGVGSALSDIDRPFVVTFGARDVAAMLDWFRVHLGLDANPAIEATMPALNRIFRFPAGTKHALGMVKLSGPCILEFDGYPAQCGTKAHQPGSLPAGIALVSCSVSDLDALPGRLGQRSSPIASAPYHGARAVVIAGPEGMLIELVERPSGLKP